MQFWIHAVEAAMSVSSEAVKVSGGATSSWNDIIKDGKFHYLPKNAQQENMSQMIDEMERDNAAELQSQFFQQRVSVKRDSTGDVSVSNTATDSNAGLTFPAEVSNTSSKADGVPVKAKMTAAQGTSNKRQKVQSKKAANAHIPASTVDFGSLNPHTESRVQHICSRATEADNASLGLFTKNDTLTRNDQQNITAALEHSPTFRLGVTDVDGN